MERVITLVPRFKKDEVVYISSKAKNVYLPGVFLDYQFKLYSSGKVCSWARVSLGFCKKIVSTDKIISEQDYNKMRVNDEQSQIF